MEWGSDGESFGEVALVFIVQRFWLVFQVTYNENLLCAVGRSDDADAAFLAFCNDVQWMALYVFSLDFRVPTIGHGEVFREMP